jgi:hypothetical protein
MRASITAIALASLVSCYEEGHSEGLPCTVDQGCDGDFKCIEGFCLKEGQSVLDACGDGEQKKAEFCYPQERRIEVDLPPVAERFFGVGDFNGDALPDFAALDADVIYTAIFDGSSFTRHEVFEREMELKLYGLSVGDLDGNGSADILVLDDNDDFQLEVNAFLGNGSGSAFDLVQSDTFAMGIYTAGVVGEFTGDGIPDVFTVEQMQNAVAQLVPGTGGGSFGAATQVTGGTYPGDRLQVADLQGDGAQDVVYLLRDNDFVTVMLAIPTSPSMLAWTLSNTIQLTTEAQPNDVMVRDLNDDGVQDLVVSHAGSPKIYVFVGNAARPELYVDRPEVFDAPAAGGGVVADLDGDGEVDLAAAGGDQSFFKPGWGFLDFGVAIEPGQLTKVARMQLLKANTDDVPDLLVHENAPDGRFRSAIYLADP